MKKNSTNIRPPGLSRASRIVAAAIECIRRCGAAKTTIEDVATEAGVGRQTIYRAFATRAELFDAVALTRLAGMQSRMKACLDGHASLERAVVHGTLQLRNVARKDPIFMYVVQAAGDRGLEGYLLNPIPAIRRVMVDLWVDAFANARSRGELRQDLPDAEIAEWLRCVSYMLFLREDLTPKDQRNLLRRFVLPALVSPPRNV